MIVSGMNSIFDGIVPHYHEAGHCVAAHVLGLTIHSVDVKGTPDGKDNGTTRIQQLANLDSSNTEQIKSILSPPGLGVEFIRTVTVYIRAGWAGAELCRNDKVKEVFDIYQDETTRSDWKHIELLQPFTGLSNEEITFAAVKVVQDYKRAVKELAMELRDKESILGDAVHKLLSDLGCDRPVPYSVPV